jgi:hypothetical protein
MHCFVTHLAMRFYDITGGHFQRKETCIVLYAKTKKLLHCNIIKIWVTHRSLYKVLPSCALLPQELHTWYNSHASNEGQELIQSPLEQLPHTAPFKIFVYIPRLGRSLGCPVKSQTTLLLAFCIVLHLILLLLIDPQLYIPTT